MTWRRVSTFSDTLTLDTVKEWLKIGYNDEDTEINILIEASFTVVAKTIQKAIFDTAYTDFLLIAGDTVPAEDLILDTDPPVSKPLIFYTSAAGVRTQYPETDILYDYVPRQRTITLKMTGDLPTVQEDSFLEAQWNVLGQDPNLSNAARLLLIGDWFENREANKGSQFLVANGVSSLLSVNSLVM